MVKGDDDARASSPASRYARGLVQEDRAARYLEEAGLVVLERNVHAAGGEIDLVCRAREDGADEAGIIVFVEVRSRADARRGHPAETLSLTKRRHVIRAATSWLVSNQLWEEVAVRFDVMTIIDDEIEWIVGAFDASPP